MKFTIKEVFSLDEHHLTTKNSKIKYIMDNQASNIVGHHFSEDELETLSDERVNAVYVDLEFKVQAKKKAGTVEEQVEKGGKVYPTLNSVDVIFKNPKYNYTTSVSAKATEESVRKYFVGQIFNVGTY